MVYICGIRVRDRGMGREREGGREGYWCIGRFMRTAENDFGKNESMFVFRRLICY